MSSAAPSAPAGSTAGSTAGSGPTAEAAKGDSGDLRVTTSARPGSRLAMELVVTGARCQACYDATLEKLARTIRLPGFRKGRVPRPVLIQQIGPLRIRASALEELVERAFRDALREQEVAALSPPQLSEGFDVVLGRFQPGEELTFTLEMDVEPTPSLRATRGLSAEAESVGFDPGRVEELLEQSRRQLATLVPVEGRTAAMGDLAQVRFSGTYADSGEAIGGGSSEGMEVELQEGRMIPGFVEGLVGMAVGDTRTITCTFPDDYPQEEARSREARFEVTLLELKERELPQLDDAFARQAGEKDTLEELRADLEQRLRDDAERRHRSNRRSALLEALVEQLEVELPETLIKEEVRRLIEQTASQFAQQGMDVKKLFSQDLVRSLMESSRPEAEQQLRRRLALQALAAAEGIEVGEEAIEARLQEVRRDLRGQTDIDPQRLRAAVVDDLLQDALFDWLEQNSTVTEKAPADGSGDADEEAEVSTRAEAGASGSA